MGEFTRHQRQEAVRIFHGIPDDDDDEDVPDDEEDKC